MKHLVLITVLAFAAALPRLANAHAQLLKAAPAVGATVTAPPTELRLTFSEGVEPAFCGITLTTAGGKEVPLGKPGIAGNAKVLVAPISAPLGAGSYKVTWHAVSVDTHRTQGSYGFTVQR